jgi:hypothetical protein
VPTIKNTMEKLKRSVRLKSRLEENPTDHEENYNAKLYIPSHWQPPEASKNTEMSLILFEKQLIETAKQNTANSTSKSNLTRLQKNCLKKIMNDRRFIDLLASKCGTAMDTSCACSYATLYWAYFERKHILPKWSHSLLFYVASLMISLAYGQEQRTNLISSTKN